MKKLYENLKVKLGLNSLDPSALLGIISSYEIDSGFNANGNWKKYKDGTLLQYGKKTNQVKYESAYGGQGLSYFTCGRVNYPIAFIDEPIFKRTIVGRAAVLIDAGTGIEGTNTISPLNRLAYVTSTLSSSVEINWIAIGRWK